MKSGLACALTAFKNMVKKVGERGELPEKPFSMICSVDEEDFMRGVEAAIKAGWVTKMTGSWIRSLQTDRSRWLTREEPGLN